jgi:hypothetical protein
MNIKYVGMDVHKEAITMAVMNGDGKLVMESIVETKTSTILQFIQGLRGDLHVTLEEGTWSAWLYDLLKPYVTELVVCDPRKNALLKEGNKSDKIDARKLADLLRGGYLRSVYHGENGLRTLKELARSYLTISKDLTRVMNRVKALYRSGPVQESPVGLSEAIVRWVLVLPLRQRQVSDLGEARCAGPPCAIYKLPWSPHHK